MATILALRKLRQVDCFKFVDSLGYMDLILKKRVRLGTVVCLLVHNL